MKLSTSLLSALMVTSVSAASLGLAGVSEARTISTERVHNGTFDLGLQGWTPGANSRLQIRRVDPKGGPAAILRTTKAGPAVLAEARPTVSDIDSGAAFTASVRVKGNRRGLTGRLVVRETTTTHRLVDRNAVKFKLSTRKWTKVALPVEISTNDTVLDIKVKARQRVTDRLTVDSVSLLQTRAAAAAPTKPPRPSTPAPSGSSFLFGMGGGNVDPTAAENRMGNKLMIRRIYHSKGGSIDGALRHVKNDIAVGRDATEISFKVPLSWPQMAAGEGDTFFSEIATKLKTITAGTDHRVLLAFNHEPEDDFKDASATEQDRQRDAWRTMQNRAAGFFTTNPNVEYGVIYMGYHSFPNLGSALYPRWSLANATPSTAELDYIGLDVYEDATAPAKFRPFETRYFAPMQTFAAQRGVEWGLSETGLTEGAFQARPTWFTDMATLVKKYDGSFIDYFNTNLNSIAGWAMTPGDNREKAFGVTLNTLRKTR